MERKTGGEPATLTWEVPRHFNFKHLESAGVGLENSLMVPVIAAPGGPTADYYDRHLARLFYLIVAAGSQTSYYGREDWQQWAPGLKSIEFCTLSKQRVGSIIRTSAASG
jgi:hypothetical protein